MAEILGLVAACCQILAGIITVIDHSTVAWDHTKNGTVYLEGVCMQVKITKQILESIVLDEKDIHGEALPGAIELLQKRATELDVATKELSNSLSDGGFRVFLKDFFLGSARAEKFDKMQQQFVNAQTTLITSLVAARDGIKKVFYVNVYAVSRVKDCFNQYGGEDCVPRILRLLEERGTPVENGKSWLLNEEDVINLSQAVLVPKQETVRIIEESKFGDRAKIFVDVAQKGTAVAQVDLVRIRNITTGDRPLVLGGPTTYDVAADLSAVVAATEALETDKSMARQVLSALVPGLAGRPIDPSGP